MVELIIILIISIIVILGGLTDPGWLIFFGCLLISLIYGKYKSSTNLKTIKNDLLSKGVNDVSIKHKESELRVGTTYSVSFINTKGESIDTEFLIQHNNIKYLRWRSPLEELL